MPPLYVTIPPEPPDRAVVLDRDADAWQRRGEVWVRAGVTLTIGPSRDVRPWPRLITEHGPLASLVTEAEEPEPGSTSFAQPIEQPGVVDEGPHLLSEETLRKCLGPPRHERTDATAADCATTRRAAEDDLPRSWSSGAAEPEGVAEVRDNSSRVWYRGEGPLGVAWWTEETEAELPHNWHELVNRHGPVTEAVQSLVGVAALPPEGRFIESTASVPVLPPEAGDAKRNMPPCEPLPAHLRRPVRDSPQA